MIPEGQLREDALQRLHAHVALDFFLFHMHPL